ncbi:MAG: (Fe-S)-binding protein [Chloroflexota bacterium]
MLSGTERILFILMAAICVTATINTFGNMGKLIWRGQGELNFKELPTRVIKGLSALLTQGRIIRHRKLSSIIHLAVAYGFLFFLQVNLYDVLEGFAPGIIELFHDTIFGQLFRLAADFFGTIVLLGVAYFLIRRFAFSDQALITNENVKLHPKARAGGVRRDSLVVGIFILLHIGFRMLSQSFLIVEHQHPDLWQPVANVIAIGIAALIPAGWDVVQIGSFGWHISWWISVGLIVLFLPYFPYTKHAHLFMGPANFMLAPEKTYLGQLKTLDFEDESIEQFGVSTIFDLPKTNVMDAFACIMCNRCQEVCPAYNTGKELSPAALEINKRYYMKEHMDVLAIGEETAVPMLDYAISESAVWACTACGHCVDICPVGNAPMIDILEMRRDLVLMNSEFPEELKGAFVGMERQGNPWQSTEDRMEWAAPLPFEVKTVEENPDFDYLLWVGCAGAFNPDAQETVRAVATILQNAGVSFAVLGDAETCTGDPARRAGNEYLYFELASQNIEVLNEVGADKKKIVTSCPHCLSTIGGEYGELGGHYTVYHHTQMISDLVGQGKLTLKNNVLETVTYHDPCYLGRHNGIVEEPRDALARAGVTLLEMDRNGKDSFCCGAGGSQYWKEEEHGSEEVNVNRFEEAHATGAETLAVGCPFCATMMTDANGKANNAMKIKDIAQIVVDAM